MRIIPFLYVLIFVVSHSIHAQESPVTISVSGGAVGSIFLQNTRLPGYTVRLWGEKKMSNYENRNYWLAVEHSVLPAKADEQKAYNPGSSEKATYHYYPSSVTTLTFGGRKYLQNNFVFGVGAGLSVHRQGLSRISFPDPSMNFESNKYFSLWGLGTAAHFGYEAGPVQLLLTCQGSSTMFRTINLDDPDDVMTESSVFTYGLGVAYRF